MTFTIRPACLSDLDTISQIETICFPSSEAASKESLKARLHIFKDSFFVAESNEQIIGFINGAVINSPTISDIFLKMPLCTTLMVSINLSLVWMFYLIISIKVSPMHLCNI